MRILIASNSVVVYLRLLTSAQIRADPDSYAPFLSHPETGELMEPREFCENFVEAVGKEAGWRYQYFYVASLISSLVV